MTILKILCFLQGVFLVINHLLLCNVTLQIFSQLQWKEQGALYTLRRGDIPFMFRRLVQSRKKKRCALYVPKACSSICFEVGNIQTNHFFISEEKHWIFYSKQEWKLFFSGTTTLWKKNENVNKKERERTLTYHLLLMACRPTFKRHCSLYRSGIKIYNKNGIWSTITNPINAFLGLWLTMMIQAYNQKTILDVKIKLIITWIRVQAIDVSTSN